MDESQLEASPLPAQPQTPEPKTLETQETQPLTEAKPTENKGEETYGTANKANEEDERKITQVREGLANEGKIQENEEEAVAQGNRLLFLYRKAFEMIKANIKNPAIIGSLTAAGIGILNSIANLPLGSEVATSLGAASLSMGLPSTGVKDKIRNATVGGAAGIALTQGVDTGNLIEKMHIKGAEGILGIGDDLLLILAIQLKKLFKR